MKVNKKALVARTLGVGKERVLFNKERLADIKEAITRQDIRDLAKDGAIIIKEVSGRKFKVRVRKRKREGNVRKVVNRGKKDYVNFVRKARAHLRQLKQTGAMSNENFIALRKELKSRRIDSRTQLKERITQVNAK